MDNCALTPLNISERQISKLLKNEKLKFPAAPF
jgi:hypothetical protein